MSTLPKPPPSSQPLVFFNGAYVPFEKACIPIWDLGFTVGAMITEHLRTVSGQIRLLDKHLNRLRTGLEIIGIEPNESLDEMGRIATGLVHQHREILPDEEFGIGICLTPGADIKLLPESVKESNRSSTTLIYTYRLPVEKWKHYYDNGIHLRVVETREVHSESVPRQLKHRSRIHYYLAEREARNLDPESRALLLDRDGNVAEGTIASVALVIGNTIVVPPKSDVLPGITAEHTFELVAQLNLKVVRRKIAPEEIVESADEVLWMCTTATIFPVTQVNGVEIGSGRPGPVYAKLTAAWK